ncbi:TPA: ParB/Srx family N-terminal domain-containing protein [Yersinia enterocolitica]
MSNIELIDIDDLELDEDNPRLPEGVDRSQHSMINYIAKSTSIEDLMGAISQNGFFSGEPLIVIPNKNGKYTVVEGNRRLSSVRLIVNPYLCEKPSTRMVSIHSTNTNSFEQLPVIKKLNRDEVLPYLGFRHITGIKQWEPLSKARYIKQLFDLTDPHNDPMQRYFDVAQKIGSRRDHIKRNLDALAVYKIIEAEDFFGIDKLDEESIKFSILSTALADERLGSFVGVEVLSSGRFEPSNPIIDPSMLNRDAIKELTEWLYLKDEGGNTRVGESRNLRQLCAVVASPKSLQQFRDGASLNVAYQLTTNIGEDFLEILYQVEILMIEAAGMVANVGFSHSAFDVAKRINKNIKMVGTVLADKERKDDDF